MLARIGLAACLLLFAVQALWLDYTVDDAFITFRYARNLAEGHGLVYNPGGERVEGFSNPSWTLALAAAQAVGLEPEPVARGFGLLAGLLAILLTERLARQAGIGHWSVAAAALLAANPALVTWSVAGLETSLFAALAVATALAVCAHRAVAAGLLMAATVWTRPEGLLMAGLIALGCLVAEGRAGGRRLLPVVAIAAAAQALQLALRWLYFDALLPNTFHAKTGDWAAQVRSGLPYTREAVVAFAGGPFLLLLMALALSTRRRGTTVASVTLLGWLAYVVAVGGDGLPMFRFVVPALPFLAVVAAVSLSRMTTSRPTALVVTLFAMVATASPGLHGRQYALRAADATYFVPRLRAVGRDLRRLVGDDASIALLPAGVIPFYSDLETVDMLALNDRVVARKRMRFTTPVPGHWKYDADEVLARRPDYILLGNIDVTDRPRPGPIPPTYAVEGELTLRQPFQRGYRQVSFPLSDGRWLNLYQRLGAPPPPTAPLLPGGDDSP